MKRQNGNSQVNSGAKNKSSQNNSHQHFLILNVRNSFDDKERQCYPSRLSVSSTLLVRNLANMKLKFCRINTEIITTLTMSDS